MMVIVSVDFISHVKISFWKEMFIAQYTVLCDCICMISFCSGGGENMIRFSVIGSLWYLVDLAPIDRVENSPFVSQIERCS